MIWSNRARNRSFDPVVLCFFGRIVPSDAPQNHGSQRKGIHKSNCKVWGSQALNPCNLKCPRIRKTDSGSITYTLVHGRRMMMVGVARRLLPLRARDAILDKLVGLIGIAPAQHLHPLAGL